MADAESKRPPRSSSNKVDDFYARGEQAWDEYLRTGVASPVDAVFARIEGLIAKRRAQLSVDQGRKQS